MRLLLLLLALVAAALADTYSATPGVLMASPLPSSVKARLDLQYFDIDATTLAFATNITVYYQYNTGASGFARARAQGSVMFSAPQLIEFAFDNASSPCTEIGSSPLKLCPFLPEQLTGPWVFGAVPATGATTMLVIQSSTYRIDPATGKAANFLGATRPFAMACVTPPCADIAALVPPAPLPAQLNTTVRRSEDV
jgi:hypothetical protein